MARKGPRASSDVSQGLYGSAGFRLGPQDSVWLLSVLGVLDFVLRLHARSNLIRGPPVEDNAHVPADVNLAFDPDLRDRPVQQELSPLSLDLQHLDIHSSRLDLQSLSIFTVLTNPHKSPQTF